MNTRAPRDGNARPAGSEHDRYGRMTAEVAAFLQRLRRTPLEMWMRSADVHASTHARSGGRANTTADSAHAVHARLRGVMDTMPHVERRIHRRIEREAAIAHGIAPADAVARMKRAAGLAACAVAARPFLAPEEFEHLYHPFHDVIPHEELAER